ncbi:caspase family protein, partial [Armatimonas sp.]|uniref:caspase family protein n=1 Tax=Armatimonas sp. TaxID=1872638 RepID=UPI00286D2169
MKKTLAGNKIAIVIGVSGYARPKSSGLSEWRELHTAQDVLALKHTLITRFGFTVTPLVTPQQTSRKAILDTLDKLPLQLKPGDTVYIHFSGHGDGDEERGSESLVPSDWRPRNHPQGDNHITNQELAQRITKIKSQLAGGAFFLSFDCCYSGYIASYTRSGGAVIRGRDRSVPRPARTLPKPSATQPKQVLLDQGSTPLILGNAPSAQGRGFTALYACRYNETAKELESPRAMGALTCSLVEALLALPPGATYRELFERVRTRVVAQVDDQHPEAEGDLDRLVFGEKRLPQPKGVPVRLAGGIPQLLAGRLHGVTEGSLYTIYSQKGELPIAQGRVAQVELLQANLILDSLTPLSPAQKAALVTARAVEVKHSFEPPRFAVDLSPIQTYPTAPALRAALEQVAREKGLLRIAGSN